MNEYTTVNTVSSVMEAREKINELMRFGYATDNIFVLTHDKDRTEHVAKNTNAETIGTSEEGVMTTIANWFRSTGDELRAKMRAVGVSKEHAEHLERELDQGKIVIIAWRGGRRYGDSEYDDTIRYYPPYAPYVHNR